MITKKLKIIGHVQGVGFRYSMLSAAHRIGVTGWVKNSADKSVESIVQGHVQQINDIIEWAQHGPSSAQVDHVQVEDATGEFSDFRIV